MATGFIDRVSQHLVKIGPKGYEHGWHFVGVPGVGDVVHHSGPGIRPGHGRGTVSHVDGQHVHVSFDNGHKGSYEHDGGKGPAKFMHRGDADKPVASHIDPEHERKVRYDNHLANADDAIRRGDHAAAIDHLNGAANTAPNTATEWQIRDRQHALSQTAPHSTPHFPPKAPAAHHQPAAHHAPTSAGHHTRVSEGTPEWNARYTEAASAGHPLAIAAQFASSGQTLPEWQHTFGAPRRDRPRKKPK